jgi:hypothetical protein
LNIKSLIVKMQNLKIERSSYAQQDFIQYLKKTIISYDNKRNLNLNFFKLYKGI